MHYNIHIKNEDWNLTVGMGQSILEAGLADELALPHSCRSGNCGTCKCRLLSGEVEMSPYSEFALSDEEKQQGLILACRAVPWSDCEIELLDDDDLVAHPQRNMRCRVESIEDATHDIKIIRLSVESGGPFVFSSGQYAEIKLPGLPHRSFSMASQVADDLIEFHIRRVPGGKVSEFVSSTLSVGNEALVRGPLGSAFLRESREGAILAIAGGSGLAPIKSIIDRALSLKTGEDVCLYYGARDERDIYLEDHFVELQALHPNFEFIPVLSEPQNPTDRRVGLVTDAVKSDHVDLEDFSAYLAGPPPMVEAAEVWLREQGVPRSRIHADAFYTSEELLARGDVA